MNDSRDNKMADEQLMLNFQAGDQLCYEKLVFKYQNPIYHFVYRLVRNEEEAEELTQETFIKVYKNVASYNPVGKFKTWLFTVARNLCVDHFRKKKVRRTESLDEMHPETEQTKMDLVKADLDLQDDVSRYSQLYEFLGKCLDSLNEDQKEVFLLREKMGFKFEEIAEMTNVSVNTVKSRMRYAVEGIKKQVLESPFIDILNADQKKFLTKDVG